MDEEKNKYTAQSILLYPKEDTAAGVMNRLLWEKEIVWEEILKLKIKPRPAWLPKRLYEWLLGHLLFIEITKGKPGRIGL